jgi:LPS-assembly protein
MSGVALPALLTALLSALSGAAPAAAQATRPSAEAPRPSSSAQVPTLTATMQQRAAQSRGRLLVEAEEVVYDNNNNRVEARGNVQIYYQGRVLEADRVIYDRTTRRVFAVGNTKISDTNGQVIYGERFEITDDFRDGFIDSLRLVTPDKQRFSAARGERSDGETTVFERGTYTACEPCKDNPERPPLWQVKAARIIAKNSEQMIYYEDATIEFFGVPLAWVPFFSAPDPTVTRKSGLLAPRYFRRSSTGYGFQLPIYVALAPNYDILFTPTALSRQGFLGQVEWRHRLETGIYNIRATGIRQADSRAFVGGPFGPNFGTNNVPGAVPATRDFRGSIETTGRFLINKNWSFGWDVTLATDKFFQQNYRVRTGNPTNNYFRETISQVYLRGQTERAWFDLRGYHFQGNTAFDWQKQLPTVHPALDFNRRFTPALIGGELSFDLNVTSVTRDAAHFQGVPTQAQLATAAGRVSAAWNPSLFQFRFGDQFFGLYDSCAVYQRGFCLVRGIGGSYTRASATMSWRRAFIDPIGQVWTPFASARVDLYNYALNNSRYNADPVGNPFSNQYGNIQQQSLFGVANTGESGARAMPAIGLEYRYPLVASTGWATHMIEPIAQVIARPNETRIGALPNEDAQSLLFDDTNLFDWNKFSGYDRIEGGVRANIGAQYTATFNQSGYANLLVGQSYHLAGRNSFSQRDLVNTALGSGLDKRRSDFVARAIVSPHKDLTLAARGRFDEETLKLKRLELQGTANFGVLTTSVIYGRYDAQPEIGQIRRREGLQTAASLKLPNNWKVSGSVLFDLDRYIVDRDQAQADPLRFPNYNRNPFRVAALGLGLGYQDECTTFSLNYTRSIADNLGATKSTNHVFLLRLELRHLGQVSYSQNLAPTTQDGIQRP